MPLLAVHILTTCTVSLCFVISCLCLNLSREVKLPGKDSKSPQSFAFGTPYLEIHDHLAGIDEDLFRRNSVLGLLARDAATKRAPERWQALRGDEVASFDVVVCFESRVFDLVVEGTGFFVGSRCDSSCGCKWYFRPLVILTEYSVAAKPYVLKQSRIMPLPFTNGCFYGDVFVFL